MTAPGLQLPAYKPPPNLLRRSTSLLGPAAGHTTRQQENCDLLKGHEGHLSKNKNEIKTGLSRLHAKIFTKCVVFNNTVLWKFIRHRGRHSTGGILRTPSFATGFFEMNSKHLQAACQNTQAEWKITILNLGVKKPGWLTGGTPEGTKIGDIWWYVNDDVRLWTYTTPQSNTQGVAEHTEGWQSELDIGL